MFMMNMIFMNLLMSIIFIFIKYPLIMGMMLLIQTLLICLISGMMMNTFWFSYILFIIFLGGMMVLFMYMTSIASNEKFIFFLKLFIFFFLFIFFSIIMIIFLDQFNYYPNMENMEMNKLSNTMNLFFSENSLNLIKLYNFPTNMILILLINYLLLTLIIIVKITNIFKGPLRSLS